MKILVIGASGRTGREFVQQGLARGHHVTGYVRTPEKVTLKNEWFTILAGSVTNEAGLRIAMDGHDAVVSALGPREPFKPDSLLQDSATATTRAMDAAGLKRFVVLSAAAHFPGILNGITRFILRNHMRDSLAMERVVEGSGLDWTIARPPRLTQGDYFNYRSRENAAPPICLVLSRKAVAAFMLDAIEHGKHVQRIVGIAK